MLVKAQMTITTSSVVPRICQKNTLEKKCCIVGLLSAPALLETLCLHLQASNWHQCVIGEFLVTSPESGSEFFSLRNMIFMTLFM